MGNQTAITIGVAFDNTFVGFSGSSQTNYTTAMDLEFYYGENGYLCGKNPPGNFGYR